MLTVGHTVIWRDTSNLTTNCVSSNDISITAAIVCTGDRLRFVNVGEGLLIPK
jgi:hypothetical protein